MNSHVRMPIDRMMLLMVELMMDLYCKHQHHAQTLSQAFQVSHALLHHHQTFRCVPQLFFSIPFPLHRKHLFVPPLLQWHPHIPDALQMAYKQPHHRIRVRDIHHHPIHLHVQWLHQWLCTHLAFLAPPLSLRCSKVPP